MRPLFRPFLYCLLAYALYISGLDKLGFVGPDEPRYADVARAMLRTGDYITPHLYGAPWFEKPPLYYWLTTLAFRLNVNEVTARLPSAFAAAFFLGFWFWFARRFYGDGAAQFSCLLLATTAGWIGLGRAAAMDMLFTTTLATALGLLALWLWEDRPAGLYGFYALLALATLAKGPLALALAGLVVGGYVTHRREWKLVPRMLWTPALGLFAVIALPWYALCYARNGQPFVEEFFLKHNIERLVSAAAIGHAQPLWFYLPILPAALFPWTPTLLLPLRELLQKGWRRAWKRPERVFLLYWMALPFLFFSLSENKLPGYLLPILPPVTLWIADCLNGPTGQRSNDAEGNRACSPRFVNGLIGLSILLLLSGPWIAMLLPAALAAGLRGALKESAGASLWQQVAKGPVPLAAWIVLAGLVVFSFVLLWRGQRLGAAFSGMLGVAWLVLLLTTYLSPSINRAASIRTVAQRIESYDITPNEFAVFYLRRNQVYGLGFYLDALPPEWDPQRPLPDINFVAAWEDIRVDELRPGAHPLSLFPGQRLRLWQLTPRAITVPLPASSPAN